MIFVTVGTQLPFDRLTSTVDVWAAEHRDVEIFAQLGPDSKFTPSNIEYANSLTPDHADELFQKATVIVSHAGMGSILTALKYQKPILIMPRRSNLGEHRNDHQLATAEYLGTGQGVNVAWDEGELIFLLNEYQSMQSGEPISEHASPELIDYLKEFISGKN